MDKIKETAGRSESSPVKSGARKQAPPVYRHPIFLNNPNFVKRKRLIVTKNAEVQTIESEFQAKLNEQAIENKVASKLVKMLISKGVSKIIKKYGYLPVDYLNENEKSPERDSKTPRKKSSHKAKRD